MIAAEMAVSEREVSSLPQIRQSQKRRFVDCLMIDQTDTALIPHLSWHESVDVYKYLLHGELITSCNRSSKQILEGAILPRVAWQSERGADLLTQRSWSATSRKAFLSRRKPRLPPFFHSIVSTIFSWLITSSSFFSEHLQLHFAQHSCSCASSKLRAVRIAFQQHLVAFSPFASGAYLELQNGARNLQDGEDSPHCGSPHKLRCVSFPSSTPLKFPSSFLLIYLFLSII
jgi:hypothetical protein